MLRHGMQGGEIVTHMPAIIAFGVRMIVLEVSALKMFVKNVDTALHQVSYMNSKLSYGTYLFF